ncbi:MAG TPA: DEAD/DEAH box helicase [Coleofasciculaceae cyanobacterium]|jgi:hypothetical protein
MNYSQLKVILADPEQTKHHSFSLLRGISNLVNHHKNHDKGRELVIRALAQLECFEQAEKEILFSLVRTVGLFPYMTEHLSLASLEDLLAYELHRPENMKNEVVFHSLQARIYHQILQGSNVVLSANTSVGKSLVIDAVIASGKFRKIVIVVPTLALIDETRRRLLKRFGATCSIITHPTQNQQEKRTNIYILTQERTLSRNDLDYVDFFVIDEFYKLNLDAEQDSSRAVDLNLAFNKLVKTGAQFYLLGPNVQKIRGLENFNPHFIPSEFSTVAVDIESFGLPTHDGQRDEKLIKLCKQVNGPTIIYCQAPGSASKVAGLLIKSADFPINDATGAARDWITQHFHSEWVVREALERGIGIHHGGIPRSLQQYFIRLFNERKINFLICTSTIIEGVNTVAENVILYDRRKNKPVIDHFTYKNIMGRAGRMKKYFIGKVYVLESPPPEEDYSVKYSVGIQDSDTPLNLLLNIDKDDLTPESRERLSFAFNQCTLSPDTLKRNRHVPFQVQNQIAERIRTSLFEFKDPLTWKRIPKRENLIAVCNLIFDYLEGNSLRGYGVHTGEALYWHLTAIKRHRRDITGYLKECIDSPPYNRSNPEEKMSVSDVVDNTLKFIRNIVCHRFPKDLMVIDSIHRDVFSQLNLKEAGDYSLYAQMAENLFMKPTHFALDEYGIPIPTVQKLTSYLPNSQMLDEVLASIRTMQPHLLPLSSFEQDVLKEVQSTV